MQDKSGNPALRESVLDRVASLESTDSASIGGTTIKIFTLLSLSVIGGFFGWQAMANASGATGFLIIGASLFALIMALTTVFKPQFAAVTGSLYALSQGYVLGAISQTYNAALDGIVIQAIGLTGAILFVSLWAFSLGLIKVTHMFWIGVIIATASIALYYVFAFIIGLFGGTAPLIFDSGTWGIVFSAVIIFVATLNLILDYDFIQTIVKRGAPKKMEWYAAFALIVTLLWLYIEVLRLLSKTRQ